MIINVLSVEPEIKLQLVFTKAELENSLFDTVMHKMYNSDDYDAHKKDEDVNVTLNTKETTFEVLGKSVDEIRQIWCGDVDAKADLTKCPCFILGETDEVEEPEEDII